jgi:hypothetical protein
VLLAGGLVLWLVLLYRALRPALRQPGQGDLAPLFLVAGVVPMVAATLRLVLTKRAGREVSTAMSSSLAE